MFGKTKAALAGAFVIGAAVTEYIHALEYIYDISLCRGSKAFFFKCSNISAEIETLYNMRDEICAVRKWYADTPSENVFIKNSEGRPVYVRIFRHSRPSHRYVIAVHGYGCSGRSMLAAARGFYMHGFNVYVPDLPCHGGSYGKVIGMGQYEYKDIIQLARHIKDADPSAETALYGISMGAAAVLMAAGACGGKYGIRCAVSDCGYTNAREILGYHIHSTFRVPAFLITEGLDRVYRRKTGMRLKSADTVKFVKACKIPLLFIHGANDKIVPAYMVYKLYNAAKCEKQLEIFDNAGHGVSAFADKARYQKCVFEFLDKKMRLP